MKKIKLNPTLICEKSDDNELLIFNPENSNTMVLNQTASMLLDHCLYERDEIFEKYYEVLESIVNDTLDKENVKKDTMEMLNAFLAAGIVLETEDI